MINMFRISAKPFLLLFLLTAFAHLAFVALDFAEAARWTKLLLMPLLLLYFVQGFQNHRGWILVSLAIGFSFVGDWALAHSAGLEKYFIIGLFGFLLAHILYISVFMGLIKNRKLHRKAVPGLLLLLCLVFLYYLTPQVPNALRAPVSFYALTICLMAIQSYKLWQVHPQRPFYVFVGACLFVVSDMLLALSLFGGIERRVGHSLFIMSSYLSGQFFIVTGAKKLLSF